MGPLLVAHGVTCDLSTGRRLFERLDFPLAPGLTGLVGANGVGKSCLARILAGTLEPSAGSVQRHCAVTLLPQREAPDGRSVAEYLGDSATGTRLGHELLAGIAQHARCDALSGGQWMRLRLARTLDDAFLILDEPTNDLDPAGRAAVLRFLAERSGGTLLISHDRECLALCRTILELTNRGLATFGGGWAEYEAARDAERERLEDALLHARRERDKVRSDAREHAERRHRQQMHANARAARGGMPKLLLGARKRQAQATTGRLADAAASRIDAAAQAAAAALAEMKLQPVMYAGIAGQPLPAQKLIAAATAFNIRHRDWIYVQDLEFNWRGNLRLAIVGGNGSGKSSLLQALRGAPLSTRGELRRGGLRSVHLDQHQSALRDELTVLQNITACCPGSAGELRQSLAQFLFRGDAVHQKVGTLSGGERLRAALAQAFLQVGSPELLLLDEPTNNLDAANVEFLEQIVRGFRGAVLVVSHDPRFLQGCGIEEEYLLSPKRAPASAAAAPYGARLPAARPGTPLPPTHCGHRQATPRR